MTKSLKTLVRICEWNVDQKRTELRVKHDALTAQERQLSALMNELAREQEYSASSPNEGGFYYANYGAEVIRKHGQIVKEIGEIKLMIEAVREELSIAYYELKKFEVVAANRIKKENNEIERKEQIVLDDVGIHNFTRHHN